MGLVWNRAWRVDAVLNRLQINNIDNRIKLNLYALCTLSMVTGYSGKPLRRGNCRFERNVSIDGY